MKRRCTAILLCLLLCCTLCPVTASAETGTVTVTANIVGAEIYVNGEFTHCVTPSVVPAGAGDTVSVRLPGYTAPVQTVTAGADLMFTLLPELYPATYEGYVTERNVDTAESLCAALAAAAEQAEGRWTVIRLAASEWDYSDMGSYVSDSQALFRAAHHYTLYGGQAGVDFFPSLHLYGTEEVRLVNLRFTNEWANQLIFRVPGGDQTEQTLLFACHPAINTREIYILGCTFFNPYGKSGSLGISQCVPIGCSGSSAYGGDGTVNWYGIHFSNNDIPGALFSFAAAGDGDYNTIEDFTVCANRFTNGYVSFLTADAHSWYVYHNSGTQWSGDMAGGEIGVCENNRIQNLRISGNTFHNGSDFHGGINLQAANLGNQNNVLRNAVVCNNTVKNDCASYRDDSRDHMFESALSLCAAVVADSYGDEMGNYPQYMRPGFTHTDGNVLENITVEDNDLECGFGRGIKIIGVETGEGWQCGDGNVTRNIVVQRNEIISGCGVLLVAHEGDTRSNACHNNALEDVAFCDNTVLRLNAEQVYSDTGVLAAGQHSSNHGRYRTEGEDTYPDFTSALRRITVAGNTVTNYTYGITAAAAAGDYARGVTAKDVTIADNTVVNTNFNPWPIQDVGILAAASTMQTGIDDYRPLCNQNCAISGVSIVNNRVIAAVGVVAAGLVATRQLDYPSPGNTLSDITVQGNTLTRRILFPERNENDSLSPAAIITADIFTRGWDWQQECDGYVVSIIDEPDALAGNKLSRISMADNAAEGFPESYLRFSGLMDYAGLDSAHAATADLFVRHLGDNYCYALRTRFGYGDLDEDGTLSVLDMQRLFEYLSLGLMPDDAEGEALQAAFLAGLDVNEDGNTDILDYQALYLMVCT
ncbi:MAG: hypothetical protein IJQ17_04830 [Oscillospiraceae bacterium]|nr:hypothetical protein [Oscillospiraceae bacterium]